MDDALGARITSISMLLGSMLLCYIVRNKNGGAGVSTTTDQNDPIANEGSTLDHLIGNTPLIKLETLSKVIGCEIFVKMESLNPSGTGKDRAVQYMLRQARLHPSYGPGVRIVEGTSGSTGIALAFQCNALDSGSKSDTTNGSSGKGLQCYIVMPDDQSDEKRSLLERLGARVVVTPCCSISNKDHYVNRARRLAQELDLEGTLLPEGDKEGGAIFVDQFENEANFMAHYRGTGPEIWRQLGRCMGTDGMRSKSRLDAFVMSAGTGGTIAGVSKFLKEQNQAIQVILADPTGSSLLRKVQFGVCYTPQQSERTVRKHRYDSIVEGVGLDRITANFQQGLQAGIDGGFCVPDQEILETAHWLLRHEGLFVGSSSALNIAAAVRTAHALRAKRMDGEAVRVVTVVCDSGTRHLSRLWSEKYIEGGSYDLAWPAADCVPACIQLFFTAPSPVNHA